MWKQKAGRIFSVATKHGLQLHATWFVDASGGTTRLFARAFSLPSREYGPRQNCDVGLLFDPRAYR